MIRLLWVLLLWPFTLQAEEVDLAAFAELPILHEGRVKPLDTYARLTYQTLSSKQGGKLAVPWLARLIFAPEVGLQEPIVYLPNPEVQRLLKLPPVAGHRYSFIQLQPALTDNKELIAKLLEQEEAELTLAQNQLIEAHIKTLWLFDLSRSLSLVRPLFVVRDEVLAVKLDVPAGAAFSYWQLLKRQQVLLELLEENGVKDKQAADLTEEDLTLLRLANGLRLVSADSSSRALPVLPPQWAGEDAWHSLWSVLNMGKAGPETDGYFTAWQDLSDAYRGQDVVLWQQAYGRLQGVLAQSEALTYPQLLVWEVWYNRLNLFLMSLWIYAAGLVLLLVFLWRRWPALKAVAGALMWGGFAVHVAGIVLRVLILQRPPVATLYESIVFVGAVVMLAGLLWEMRRRDGLALLSAGAGSVFLQYVGLHYAVEGDSMGMLVAVLNTNFWLATHVVAISIGYGCSVMTALAAHVYLARRALGQTAVQANDLLKATLGLSLIALFFTALGTILGGIWADQSWGRFWGWDPKENGALLIVLWIAWLLHGRIGKLLDPFAFAAGMAFLNIIVVLAWFGVNLLNVGLHSYGFTDNILQNLIMFCSVQTIIILGLVCFSWRKPPKN